MLLRPTYANATPSCIPSLVHVKHAKVENGLSTIPSLSFLFNFLAHIFDISYKEYVKYCEKVLPPSR